MEIELAHNLPSEDINLHYLQKFLEANGFHRQGKTVEEAIRLETFADYASQEDAKVKHARIAVVANQAFELDPFKGDWHIELSVGASSDEVKSGVRPIIFRLSETEIPPFFFPAIVAEDERIPRCNVIDFKLSGESAIQRLAEKLGFVTVRDEIDVAEALLIQLEWSPGLFFDLVKAGKKTTVRALHEVDPSLPDRVAFVLEAITHRDASALSKCLANDVNRELGNFRLKGGRSLLHIVTNIGGASALIDLLLDYGYPINERSQASDTPLYYAAWADEKMAKLLTDRGADPTIMSLEGNCFLSVAAWLGYDALAEHALSRGARAFVTDINFGHPLIWASQSGHIAIVRLIIDRFPEQIDVETGAYGLGSNDPAFSIEAPDVSAFVLYRRKRVAESRLLGRTALMTAVATNQADVVDLLLARGADVNHRNRAGQSAMHQLWGTEPDSTERMLRKLVECGVDLDVQDVDGVTALTYAVRGDRRDLVQLLLEAGVNPEIKDNNGFGTLHFAASYGKTDIIFILLEKTDVEARDDKGFTPLHLSIFFKDVPIATIAALLDGKADPNQPTKDGRKPLSLLVSTQREASDKAEIARMLIEHGADPWAADENGSVAMLTAAQDGFYSFCDPALDGYEILTPSSREAGFAVVCAAAVGRIDVIDSLARRGTPVDYLANGFRALAVAALNGHETAVEFLLNNKAQVNSSPGVPTALTCAAEKGHTKIIETLLACRADPNSPGKDGQTPLFFAVGNGQLKTVKQLLDAGAYAGVRSASGLTPLHVAAYQNLEQVAPLLLTFGANIDARDANGDTPLHLAVGLAQIEFVHFLLNAGARVDIANDKRVVPMHLVALRDAIEIAKQLHARGAGLEEIDQDGDTPLHWAAMNDSNDFVDWLLANEVALAPLNVDAKRPVDVANNNSIVAKLGGRDGDNGGESTQETQRAAFLHWTPADSRQEQRVQQIWREHGSLGRRRDKIQEIQCARLPFYHDSFLVAVSLMNYVVPNQLFYIVSNRNDRYVLLDWTNGPIYDFNEKDGLFFSDVESLKIYIKFFFFFVRGQLGRFMIAEDVTDIDWNDSATGEIKAETARKLLSIAEVPEPPKGLRCFRLTCMFKNALFRTDVYVAVQAIEHIWEDGEHASFSVGETALRNEELLDEELPIEIPGSPGRFG